MQNAEMFCESFLSIGGVQCLVYILQADSLPADADYEVRQGCYIITLQLLK